MINNTPGTLSDKRIQLIAWTLLCLMPILGMTVDLVAPSLPAIASGLHVSTGMAKNVISIYLFGYALGNFFTGFLTDALGRQKLMRAGLLGFMLVSLIPLFFPRIEILLLTRFLQGFTIGAVSVTLRAVFSDILSPEKLIHWGTMIGTMWGLGPIVGPVIGGYLQSYFGWQAGFCFFALISLPGFIAVFTIIPETHFKRHPLNIETTKNNFIEVATHRVFIAMAILNGLTYSLMITFNTFGPFLIQKTLQYSPVFFGHLALGLGMVYLVSTFVCRYFLKNHTVAQLFLIAINLFFFITIPAVIASYFVDKSIVLLTTISALMFFACGFISPMTMGKGLSLFRHMAGMAVATMYLINILIASLTAFLVSFINTRSAIPMMWIYFSLMLMCVLIYWGLARKEK